MYPKNPRQNKNKIEINKDFVKRYPKSFLSSLFSAIIIAKPESIPKPIINTAKLDETKNKSYAPNFSTLYSVFKNGMINRLENLLPAVANV